jgi:hypothetical protein
LFFEDRCTLVLLSRVLQNFKSTAINRGPAITLKRLSIKIRWSGYYLYFLRVMGMPRSPKLEIIY